jgi:putative colanic acid biosynthesis UDP-glucose lipid carrier transferase
VKIPRGLLQEYNSTLSLIARVIDVLSILGGALLAHYWRFNHIDLPPSYQVAILISILLALILFSASGIYSSWRGKTWLDQARLVMFAWLGAVIILIIIGFLTKTSTVFSRQWMGMWTILATVFLLTFRYLVHRILLYSRARGWNHKKIVIVGVGELAQSVAQRIKESSWIGMDIYGFFSNEPAGEYSSINGINVNNGFDDLESFVRHKNIDEIWLALPLQEEQQIRDVLYLLRHSTVTIRFVPGIFEYRLLNHALNEIAGLPVIDLNATPMVGINRVIKALEDRILGLVILVLVSPFILAISIAIKLTSKGPVFFKQMRHGWDGKPIKVYKFRTMVQHMAENGQVVQASRQDTRVTKIGAFLRQTSLDELPQFWNVLQGRMSIVGPRPHALQHNEQYKDQIDLYMLRHKVKPGITGWAQIHGWRGETDTLDKMKKRVEYDLYYIENWSLWLDIKIIFLTLFNGFIHKNAY